MDKLKAGLNRVIVQELETKNTTKGGLVIPETSKEKPNSGIVVAVGAKSEEFQNFEVHVNDVIVYGQYAGTEFEAHEKKFKSVEIKDIVAIIDKIEE